MTIITYTREAKCKDCRYCAVLYKGKLKRHRCSNPLSPRYSRKYRIGAVRLNDLVCNKWEM